MEQEFIMRELFTTFTQDEDLLRYLHYIADNIDDNVLIESPQRPLILHMDSVAKWDIISDVIRPSKVVTELDGYEKCRLLFYMGRRLPHRGNYEFSNQQIVIDLLIHASIDERDFRVSKLTDYISKKIFKKPMKFGRVSFVGCYEINAPQSYIGYQLRFDVLSSNS